MLKISLALAVLGLALLVAPALAGTSPAPPPAAAPAVDRVAQGRALFMAKGCAQCHSHAQIQRSGQFMGAYGAGGAPDLTNRPLTPEYLRTWLKDPSAVRPGTEMPNLGLKEVEIESLIAFLRAGQQ
ncbi:MAG TPA: c-type cytochrome [Roseiflexaceae bacterium]|nr:c-type cytochrome [Roseiflexaceae bacterium]